MNISNIKVVEKLPRDKNSLLFPIIAPNVQNLQNKLIFLIRKGRSFWPGVDPDDRCSCHRARGRWN